MFGGVDLLGYKHAWLCKVGPFGNDVSHPLLARSLVQPALVGGPGGRRGLAQWQEPGVGELVVGASLKGGGSAQ